MVVTPHKQPTLTPLTCSYFAGQGYAREFEYMGLQDFSPYLATMQALQFTDNVCGGAAKIDSYCRTLAHDAVKLLESQWHVEVNLMHANTLSTACSPVCLRVSPSPKPRGAACLNPDPPPSHQIPQSSRTRLSAILEFWGKCLSGRHRKISFCPPEGKNGFTLCVETQNTQNFVENSKMGEKHTKKVDPRPSGSNLRCWEPEHMGVFFEILFTPLVYVQNDQRIMGIISRYVFWGTHRPPPPWHISSCLFFVQV